MTTIDNGAALKAARESLELTVRELADRLRLVGHSDVVVREMESGKRPITGPVAVAVELMLQQAEATRVSRILFRVICQLAAGTGEPLEILRRAEKQIGGGVRFDRRPD